jgi:type I restriction enzyme, S subunit
MKSGYKRSDVGLIPEDWNPDHIEHFAHITTGSKNTQDRFDDGQYPFFVRSQTVERINSYSFDGEAVLTAGDGVGTGKVFHYINGKFDVHQRVYRISNFEENVNGYFFYLYFSTHFYNRIMQMTAKSSVDSVRRDMIARMLVPLPPTKAEQDRIAEALSDVDGLLGGLDRLIAKKRDLKQAAMQQLLTGQTRLPGFHGKWDEVNLGSLFSFKNGLNKGKEFFGYGTPIVNYMDVFGRSTIRAEQLTGRVSLTPQEIQNFDVKKGDVFFTRTSETTEEIGIASVMLDEPSQTVFSGFVLRGRPKNDWLCDAFKAYCFTSIFVRKQIVSKASYTTRALTNGRILSAVILPVPSLPEQKAIAEVLTDMDAELAALEQRREKTRAIKQGMMQQLLTGRIRLVKPERAEANA